MIRILSHTESEQVLQRRTVRLEEAEAAVRAILKSIQEEGDPALFRYSQQFDGVEPAGIQVNASELADAATRLSPQILSAIETASRNIREFRRNPTPKRKFSGIQPRPQAGTNRKAA